MSVLRLSCFAVLLCLLALPARAELSLEQVRALPPLPAVYLEEPLFDKRVVWLKRRLDEQRDPAERYRTQRLLFEDYYYERQMAEAAAVCERNPPLLRDFAYRQRCIVATVPDYDASTPRLLALASEARQLGEAAAAARLLKDIAWRQSESGDIAGAFENFEAALTIAPAGDVELLGEIMLDTATSYIVNGDERDIRRGLQLLTDAREELERALADPQDRNDRAFLKDKLLLTHFNRGIAYALHLSEYADALSSFETVAAEPSPYREDALVFAALSAAVLGEHDRARGYLERAEREKGDTQLSGPVAQQYLRCYRQLAIRHWDGAQPVTDCLKLEPGTSLEVQLDVYKRLADSSDAEAALAGLRGLKQLLIDTIEPQLRRRASTAASHAELMRLQRESELKSVVLAQQETLQHERDAASTQRQRYLIALALLLLLVVLLVALQWRAKQKLADQYARLSVVDTLTQLGNRRFLEQHIGRELALLERHRRTHPDSALGVYLLDIDHFKSINDRFGHAGGDEVLVAIAQRIKAATRETDLLVRWGGEEFLLAARLDQPARGRQIAERILQSVNSEPVGLSGHEPIRVSCSIGAVQHPFAVGEGCARWDELVAIADLALYHAKATGRNRWVIVDRSAASDAAQLQAVLAQPLQLALDAGRVVVSCS